MISKDQIKLIWVLARQLDLNSDELHEVVAGITGKDSIKALSVGEGIEVVNTMIRAGGKVKKKRKPRRKLPPNVVEMVTGEQLEFIRFLEGRLGWQDNPQRLKAFVRRIIKREVVRTKQEGSKVIQGLKSMVSRNKGGGMDGANEMSGN
ncbi:MAG: DUF1018 domain-containing protein [Desulfovibrionales bacterium]|nr:DUF1018 domain-containing protein [Desulfovibrionales bacterium]